MRRCLRVRVGQPRVEREHRHLDGEADEQAAEDPDRGVLGDVGTVLVEPLEAEVGCGRIGGVVLGDNEQGDETNQHQRRSEHRVQEELQRGVLAILATPHADHEVHRKQHEFEEDEEQDQVLRHERAGHAGLQHEHQHEERLGVARAGHVVPAVDHHQYGDDHRQQVQRQADAIEADRVRGANRLDPAMRGEELQLLALAVVELERGDNANGKRGERGTDRDRLGGVDVLLGDEQHQQYAHQRQEGAEAEQPIHVLQLIHNCPCRSY